MGKLRGLIKGDISRVFGSSTFILAVIATSLIMLTGSIGVYSDNTRYNVFQLVADNSREEIRELGCQAIDAVYRGSSSYLWMFAPVLAGLPLIPLLCAERKNKAMRYELYRTTKNRFVVSKLISACLSGGMVMMLGYGLFCIAVYILIPFKGTSGNVIPEYMEIMAEINPFVASAYLKYGFGIIVVMKLVLSIKWSKLRLIALN